MTRVGILSWDPPESPELDDLGEILAALGGKLTVTDIDTGDDRRAWAFTIRRLPDATLVGAYGRYCETRAVVIEVEET
jgi:hypothetical protein